MKVVFNETGELLLLLLCCCVVVLLLFLSGQLEWNNGQDMSQVAMVTTYGVAMSLHLLLSQ